MYSIAHLDKHNVRFIYICYYSIGFQGDLFYLVLFIFAHYTFAPIQYRTLFGGFT